MLRGKVRDVEQGPDTSIEEILRRLKSADAGAAWSEFLDRYAGLIMKTAGQFEYEQVRVNDCFMYVCEKLSDNGFKRLLSYRSRREVDFRSWLITVLFNLCVDWHRKEFGRASLSPAITALPAFDQLVYRLSFEQGLSRNECLEALAAEFPDVTSAMLSESVARVHRQLTPRQRWQTSVRLHRKQRTGGGRGHALSKLPSAAEDPSRALEREQELEFLRTAVKALPARQQLLLHYRYRDGLTLDQIAKILHLGDTNRSWRQVQSALRALSAQYQSCKFQKYRKK